MNVDAMHAKSIFMRSLSNIVVGIVIVLNSRNDDSRSISGDFDWFTRQH